ncbi:DNA repair protein RadA [candidate division WOR_3 bacterium SM1_77]|jgi:DNA repair protein RadA/Sms|uniref:DNA repair protein RadA n=1 Tax=candidate division WOR_3 bacterium SM1_77 TaxID=1703778 RepID=A0A0S8JX48_UNCW3|nr:MAG: DNA repair protein RadA [candidate division WOR_3 bacterium SM1_77]
MKSRFVCQNCGAYAPKWLGRCPECASYNTMVEELVEEKKAKHKARGSKPVALRDVPFATKDRTAVGIAELDRVLGGGFVKGSLVLLGGDPGIGKSTLMLQISALVARGNGHILYASGEESAYQIRIRAERLGSVANNIDLLSETELESILESARELHPQLMVVDSIQTVYKSNLTSAPGSVAQVRECGGDLMRFAKENEVTTVLIGHVTKFGVIAGPKTLEHIVDTVLYFEGEKSQQYRILRVIKNRFGSTNEIGVFEMTEAGLCEVANPSSLFISHSTASGSAVTSIMEGTRPLLVEVQALTSPTSFNYPQRVATGIDYKRLAMLLAVLERRVGISVSGMDCFVNAVGGIKVTEPSCDLGLSLAIASSIRNKAIGKGIVIIGEVGLGGEVRPIYGIESRLKEAEKLGFKTAIVPHKGTRDLNRCKIEIVAVNEVSEAVKIALG